MTQIETERGERDGTEESLLLDVTGLEIGFDAPEGGHQEVVRGIDLRIEAGASVGLVGESGCGKTVTALSLLGLLPPGARRTAGRITLRGRDLPAATDDPAWAAVRGREVAMVFQEPSTALHPLLRIGTQMSETLRLCGLGRADAQRRGLELLARVALPDPQRGWRAYPHELSGGQKQRVMIAMALAAEPSLLIADEPTTALDVTIQAQILELLADLRSELDLALLLITHDLAVVAQVCERVVVLDAGFVVEDGRVAEVFARPTAPRTKQLLRASRALDEVAES